MKFLFAALLTLSVAGCQGSADSASLANVDADVLAAFDSTKSLADGQPGWTIASSPAWSNYTYKSPEYLQASDADLVWTEWCGKTHERLQGDEVAQALREIVLKASNNQGSKEKLESPGFGRMVNDQGFIIHVSATNGHPDNDECFVKVAFAFDT